MKTSKESVRKSKLEKSKDSNVYPGSLSGKDRKEMILEFQQIRKGIAEKYTANDKLIAQLLQLKFSMEDYLNSKNSATHYFFGYFLKEYISRLNKKQVEFAEDIGLDDSEISNIITKGRKPTEKVIFRLDIQSNKNFPASLWFQVLEKDRLFEIENDSSLIDREKSHVKRKLEFSL